MINQVSKHQLCKLISVVLKERKALIRLVDKYTKKQDNLNRQLSSMQYQADMMMILMRDLMNHAQMNTNTFTLQNDYFDCILLAKNCMEMLNSQAMFKKIHLLGPLFENPIDKLYFKHLYGDENRFCQIIVNFMTNGIKFTPADGVVSIGLKVTKIADVTTLTLEESKEKLCIKSEDDDTSSIRSAPDKEINEEPSPG